MRDDNYISLKAYIERRLEDTDKARDLAAENLKIRLDNLNHWRTQSKDERDTYITRQAYEAKHELLEAKIENLQRLTYIGLGIVLAVEFLFRYIKL